MELNKELNEKYKQDKKTYEKVKMLEKNLEELKYNYKIQTRKKEDAQLGKFRAKEDKDKTKEQEMDKEIKKADAELKNIKDRVRKIQNVIEKNKAEVDKYINELSNDPEFKKQIDYILEKRYERGLEKANRGKEQTDIIIDLCTNHPTLDNNFKGMVKAVEELDKIEENQKELEEELAKLDPIDDKDRIAEIENVEKPKLVALKSKYQTKHRTNKESFMGFCQKNNVNVDEKFLEQLVKENGFSHDSEGNIQALKTLKRISKGYEKQERAYEKAIGKVRNMEENHNIEIHNDESVSTETGDNGRQETNLPEPRYKWYQFGKRIKAWMEKRKVQRDNFSLYGEEQNENSNMASERPENENSNMTSERPENEKSKFGSEKFRDAYKYDIVKDYVDKKEKEILKESGKEVRRENSDNER